MSISTLKYKHVNIPSPQLSARMHRSGAGPSPTPDANWKQGCGDAVAELVRRMRRLCQRRIITAEDRRFGQPHYGHHA